ncbi:MAG: 7-carboxy-7-deazaguanine synthase QueE [Pseudomonadales bacterium]|nr:7-carboxy-7-deazaguanine synthase QueE [Gammaproteobacteria bacterium]NNL56874.1 7-carboxy-7-deazaguanine synthase QueE [Pseudomonadales bacterium]
MLASDSTLRLTEIFCSLQGESTLVGERTVFIRLTGCPLRCSYCDTAYAFHGGELMPLDAIVERAQSYATRYICVTGGEPLAQPNCLALLTRLCDQFDCVSLETSGAIDVSRVDARVKRIIDLKTPSSGEQEKNLLANLDCLNASDEIKFVIGNRSDYDWARQMLAQHALAEKAGHVLFSPVFPLEAGSAAFDYRQLADWIITDQLPVRLQLQQHKLIWGDQPGH